MIVLYQFFSWFFYGLDKYFDFMPLLGSVSHLRQFLETIERGLARAISHIWIKSKDYNFL